MSDVVHHTEDDEDCVERVRRRATAARPASTIESIGIDGERDGWAVTLEVDGHQRAVNVADEPAVLTEVRRLQAAGPRVTLIEGHVRYRPEGRRARVRYAPPLTRRRWVAELRWPRPSDPVTALAGLNDEVRWADLRLERYGLEAGVLTAVVACP